MQKLLGQSGIDGNRLGKSPKKYYIVTFRMSSALACSCLK